MSPITISRNPRGRSPTTVSLPSIAASARASSVCAWAWTRTPPSRASHAAGRAAREGSHRCSNAAIADGYKRLMAPSLERELRAKLTVRAQTEAIKVFGKNLESLLSARPVRGARVIALDPGYRTGCKVAVLDETGKLLDHGVVYPTPPRRDVAGTKRELARLVKRYNINTIVIGNGTASRETEEVVSSFIAEAAPELRYTIVNEAGASVYSASELASQEYPELDVTTRGAMSLGRRLQDRSRSL